mmetsp:Transcript_46748/g.120207  ORF Transcript_46748/g.120207 Transcript_46748/m.120207 type:complete len:370 (-) Transcript_46748:34-1143(-)
MEALGQVAQRIVGLEGEAAPAALAVEGEGLGPSVLHQGLNNGLEGYCWAQIVEEPLGARVEPIGRPAGMLVLIFCILTASGTQITMDLIVFNLVGCPPLVDQRILGVDLVAAEGDEFSCEGPFGFGQRGIVAIFCSVGRVLSLVLADVVLPAQHDAAQQHREAIAVDALPSARVLVCQAGILCKVAARPKSLPGLAGVVYRKASVRDAESALGRTAVPQIALAEMLIQVLSELGEPGQLFERLDRRWWAPPNVCAIASSSHDLARSLLVSSPQNRILNTNGSNDTKSLLVFAEGLLNNILENLSLRAVHWETVVKSLITGPLQPPLDVLVCVLPIPWNGISSTIGQDACTCQGQPVENRPFVGRAPLVV